MPSYKILYSSLMKHLDESEIKSLNENEAQLMGQLVSTANKHVGLCMIIGYFALIVGQLIKCIYSTYKI